MAEVVPAQKRSWFRRHKVLTGLGVLLVLYLLGSVTGGGKQATPIAATSPAASSTTDASSPATSIAKASPVKAPAAAGLGTTVKDGKFAFTVTAIKCGIKMVGTDMLGEAAQGQFCRVSLTVENVGNEAQSMFASNQYAFDAKGRKFTADSTASMYDDASRTLFEDINPGNSIRGHVYFDMPAGVTVKQLELHDSLFSGGVRVAL